VERSNRRLADHTGLNLIRLIIGSYFMAISLGLVQGVDHRAIFAPIFGAQTGDLIGTTVLFAISAAFMSGLYLRTTSLMLALFVLTSSLIETFIAFQPQNISAFWRDLTLMCGVLLSYYSLKPADMQRASLVGRRYISRVVKTSEQVTPRRVTPSVAGKAAKTAENRMPLQVTGDSMHTTARGNTMGRATPPQARVQTGLSKSSGPNTDQKRHRQKPTDTAAVSDKDVTNIFVES
jgi:hypothetical protein